MAKHEDYPKYRGEVGHDEMVVPLSDGTLSRFLEILRCLTDTEISHSFSAETGELLIHTGLDFDMDGMLYPLETETEV